MSVKIGHASIDENGKIANGAAGDQTGKEVCKRDWYNKGWNKLIRAKDPVIAEKIAIACEAACNNDNIGYDQNQRLTLNAEAKKVNHVLANIKTKCECDCSSLVGECVIAAGINVSPAVTTRNMVAVFNATGQFEILTDSKYLNNQNYLKRGDILVKEGSHTVCVLTSGNKIIGNITQTTEAKKVSHAQNKDLKVAGKYKTTSNLNLRYTPGVITNDNIVCVIPSGAFVQCYGYYTTVNNTKWYLIVYKDKSGFVSSNYLKKQ